jgi:hypothetical protein
MMTAWVFAAFLAELSGGPVNPASRNNSINQPDRSVLVPLSGTVMRCTKEGDHLMCVVPLGKETAKKSESATALAARPNAHKPSQPALPMPAPEAFAQLKAAEANIELAKSLLPKVTAPEEAVLVQQMLYRAREQYRTARALLHTVQDDLRRARDPFDGEEHEGDTSTLALCRSEVDLAEGCQTAIP